MRLEKFDLEKALNGAKIVTRNGHEVKELTKFEGLKDYPLAGILFDSLASWTIYGFYFDTLENNLDLFLAVEVQSAWVNIYRHGNGREILTSNAFKTKEQAIKNIFEGWKYIKTIEITDEL